MAKQAQSSSQFPAPQSTIRRMARPSRRTAVIQPTTFLICSAASPRGRPTSLREARTAPVTTRASGFS